jgi:methylase of polypeptide subunit release factors
MKALGIDVSDVALKLARENLMHNVALGHLATAALEKMSFIKANLLSNGILSGNQMLNGREWDIVVSNPPYISETGFNKDTSRSVRNWEPKLALVPPDLQLKDPRCSRNEDIFYPRILDIAASSNAKIVLMEVAGTEQALRIAQIASNMRLWKSVEVWRDWPGHVDEFAEPINDIIMGEHVITFKGAGHGRAVVCKQ